MLFALLIAGVASASPAGPVLDVWVQLRDEEDRRTLRTLGMNFVESEDGDWRRFHGEPTVVGRLRESGIPYRLAVSPLTKTDHGHHSPAEMVEAMEELADAHPDAAELFDLGTSVEGRPIVGLRLTRASSPRARLRVLGAHHGDETSSAEVSLASATRLLEDPSLAHILDEAEAWFVPHVNPDGLAALRRYNANSVDLNRNYGFEWSSSSFRPGPAPFSEPETQAIRALSAWVDFGLGLSVHSGAVNLGWVWNFTTDLTPDEELLSDIADVYAEDCTTEGFWTTNGADWYTTNGDTTDWSYGRYGTLDYTLEVSVDKHPDELSMARVLDEHTDAIPALMDWPWWVSGWVSDASTGLPVQATVTLVDDGQSVVSGPDGHFSRPVGEAVWSVSVSALGYEPVLLDIEPWSAAVDVALEPTVLSPIEPEGRWLSPDGLFSLDGAAETVALHRPGHPEVWAEPTGDRWQVDPVGLNPGPWSLIIDDQPLPNALFIPEPDPTHSVGEVTRTAETIEIVVPNVGRGARVWRLEGTHRSFVRVETTVDLAQETLLLPPSALPDSSSELVIWTRGMQLALTGVESVEPEDEPEWLDTGEPEDTDPDLPDSWEEPADDTVGVDDGGELKAGGCQVVTTDYPHLIWLVSLIGLTSRRRSQCAPHHCSSPSPSSSPE